MTDRIRGLPQTKEHGARSVSDVSLEVLGPAYFNTAAALMGYQVEQAIGIWVDIPHLDIYLSAFFPASRCNPLQASRNLAQKSFPNVAAHHVAGLSGADEHDPIEWFGWTAQASRSCRPDRT